MSDQQQIIDSMESITQTFVCATPNAATPKTRQELLVYEFRITAANWRTQATSIIVMDEESAIKKARFEQAAIDYDAAATLVEVVFGIENE